MSFSSSLKKEICLNRSFIYSRKEAVCFGLVLFGRSFDEKQMMLSTENRLISRLYSELLYELVHIKTSITATEQILGENRKLFVVRVDSAEDRLEIIKYFAPIYKKLQCCKPETSEGFEFLRGILCGAFLSCANISNPQKSYHLEFVVHNELAHESICALLDKLEMAYKLTNRKSTDIIYVKSSEEIEDVLTMLGAGKSALEVMNVKVYKNMRNKVNRITNCETANIDRTVTASAIQLRQIRLIKETIGIEALPENLREIAAVRLENPDLSLTEIASLLKPPITRSGVHYRFKQLAAIADELPNRAEKN